MSDSTELLVLRLGLLAILLAFVLLTAVSLGTGRVRRAAPVAARPSSDGVARLVLVAPAGTGFAPGATFSVAGEMTLGRDPTNGIVLPDPSVSARHAMLARQGGAWFLSDLGSTNGTAVNGKRVGERRVKLKAGDAIELGSVQLRLTR